MRREEILLGLEIFLVVLFFVIMQLLFSYSRKMEEKSIDEMIVNIMKEAGIDPMRGDFNQIKGEIEYFLLDKGFTLYLPDKTTFFTCRKKGYYICKKNDKEYKNDWRWVVVGKEGIEAVRLKMRDENISLRDGTIRGYRGFSLRIPKTIRELDLTHSYLSSLELKGYKNLEVLELDSCHLLSSIEFKDLPSLRRLNLTRTSLKNISLSDLPSLQQLYINDDAEEVELSNLSSMRNVDFSDTSHLKKVSFSDMPLVESINLKGCWVLSTATFKNLGNLKEINLSKDMAIKEIEIVNLPNLSKLNLSKVYPRPEVWEKLALPTIRELDLSWNNLKDKEVDLSNLPQLSYLNIEGNPQVKRIILSRSVKGRIKIDGVGKDVKVVFR